MIGTNLLVPLVALLVAPILARELGAEGRGLYTALTAPVLLAGVVGTFGMQDGLTQFVARRGMSTRAALKVAAISVLVLSTVTAGMMWAAGFLLFQNEDQRYAYALVLSTIPIMIGHNLVIGIATGAQDTKGLNGTKLIPAIARAALVLTLCLVTNVTPLGAALILVATPALGILWQVWRVMRLPSAVAPSSRAKKRANRRLLRFSLATFPGLLAAMAMTRVDQVLGLPLLGAEQLGFYAIAVTVAELPMMVASAGRSYILGLQNRTATKGIPRFAWVVLAVNTTICLTLMAIVPWLLPLVFGEAFAGAVAPCMVLLIGTIFFTAMSLGSALLLNSGKAHVQSVLYVVAAMVGTFLLFVFSSHGALGAAAASVTGYAVAAISCWIVVGQTTRSITKTMESTVEFQKITGSST